ncbi:hypothetical protein RB195_023253 [Necator americanus]
MEDLPDRRVQRARPFEHVGIDYFGPLTVKERDETVKAYGIIMTCPVTRLLHLELVSDMTTANLLNALRRFFAGRGVPTSITSDNGPYFLLGEQILQDAVLPVINDKSFANAMATKGITWKTTPYAPWKGAFYERLIKSVKHSLYKVIQGRFLTKSGMETLLIEIEGSLNTRPLSYQEQHWDETPILRSIDYIQRDMVITFPFETCSTGSEDENYLPLEETIAFRNRRQAEEALKSSHVYTERFRKIWSQQYLSSIRETHKLEISNKRGSRTSPTLNKVMLISDPVMPRISWKIGIIRKLKQSLTGVVREAEIQLPKRRLVRRPVNLLVPIELDDNEEAADGESANKMKQVLAPWTKPPNLQKTLLITLMLLSLLALFNASVEAVSTPLPSVRAFVRCSPKGVELTSFNAQKYELCAREYCIVKEKPPKKGKIQLPPEITLQDYFIQWKISDGHQVTVVEATCPQVPFCENV